MKNFWICCCFLFFVFLSSFVQAETSAQEVGATIFEKIGDFLKNIGQYSEILGENLLKFQNFFMGALSFLSFGAFGEGGTLAFVQFLFMILVFMVVYTSVGFFSDSNAFILAIGVTLLGFFGMGTETLEMIFLQWKAVGLIASVLLPTFVVLAFSFRIYQKAYEGKTQLSPFWAEVINFFFLIGFGIFFIRYAASEEGAVSLMRIVCGWGLVIVGVAQTLLFKIIVEVYRRQKVEDRKFKENIRQMKRDFLEAKEDMKLRAEGLDLR